MSDDLQAILDRVAKQFREIEAAMETATSAMQEAWQRLIDSIVPPVRYPSFLVRTDAAVYVVPEQVWRFPLMPRVQ